MKVFRKKRTYVVTAILLCVITVIAVFAYFAYPMVRYSAYNTEEREKIPENFYLEIPYTYNQNNHFCIPCESNGNKFNLIVDTKATCLMKDTDIKKNGGIYFGKLPIESRNSYGEKYNPQLYYSPNFKMYTFPTAPLFKSTHKDNYIYHISDEGVLGVNMLEVCAWKFSVDDTKVKLFGNDDSLRLSEESKDFIKIENGLNKNAIKMRLGNPGIDADFTLNLGQSGEILVDNNVASELKKQYLYKTILTLKYDNGQDTMHIFEDVPLEWKGIKIEHCLVGNKPNFFYKQNFIGAKLMHRFNSILSFVFENEDYDDRDLYIQPSKDFNTFKCEPIIAFGMNIGIKDNCMKVVNLEEGGIAARNGIKLGDEILQIDSCTFEGKDIKNKFMQYAANKKEIKIQLKDRSVVLK